MKLKEELSLLVAFSSSESLFFFQKHDGDVTSLDFITDAVCTVMCDMGLALDVDALSLKESESGEKVKDIVVLVRSSPYFIFQEYKEPVYSYSTYPDRRFSSRYPNILKMSPPFASSEGVSASGDRYQSDGVWHTRPLPHSDISR